MQQLRPFISKGFRVYLQPLEFHHLQRKKTDCWTFLAPIFEMRGPSESQTIKTPTH